jgi:hypothetical protein
MSSANQLKAKRPKRRQRLALVRNENDPTGSLKPSKETMEFTREFTNKTHTLTFFAHTALTEHKGVFHFSAPWGRNEQTLEKTLKERKKKRRNTLRQFLMDYVRLTTKLLNEEGVYFCDPHPGNIITTTREERERKKTQEKHLLVDTKRCAPVLQSKQKKVLPVEDIKSEKEILALCTCMLIERIFSLAACTVLDISLTDSRDILHMIPELIDHLNKHSTSTDVSEDLSEIMSAHAKCRQLHDSSYKQVISSGKFYKSQCGTIAQKNSFPITSTISNKLGTVSR